MIGYVLVSSIISGKLQLGCQGKNRGAPMKTISPIKVKLAIKNNLTRLLYRAEFAYYLLLNFLVIIIMDYTGSARIVRFSKRKWELPLKARCLLLLKQHPIR
jgi:hypothetical protein